MTTPAIVVLTDFFAVSNRALSYAAGLAVPLQSHLVLLHVRHDGLLSPEEYADRHAERNARQTQQALYALAEGQPVPTQVEISEAFLPDAVAEAVRHHQPQLLVLGRPGTATTPVEVVTSAALDVLRHVPFPLLIVPTVGWDTFPPRRLALAVDGDSFSLYDNQHIVSDLLQALQGTLDVIHVVDQHDPGAEAYHRAMHTAQQSGVATALTPEHVRIVYHPKPAEGILQGAAEVKADLLVVVARRHSLLSSLFHRSVTAQLISESPVPVLLLPALD
ncbi:universal stress protein [Hymenobacter sp. BT491]|uniref:universal stress protein n=1 Tax=Hymenobacter sp. BT491 TaxID=2766779 RepID=UPI001653CBAF|nr:universal stress protein [Hymenobacter sp. BT491]MBC6990546.1 universal stress protein [Hymenobacter sp. BT491]